MSGRTGRRDRRAQRRTAVEALLRAGWSAAETQRLLDLADAEGLDLEEVAWRLLLDEVEERWEDEQDEGDGEDEAWCPLCLVPPQERPWTGR